MGNEGVLIEYQGKKVIIDALFTDPTGKFHTPDYDLMDDIIAGKSPYEGVNTALVTHTHADHFDAPSYVNYLKNNKDARVIATPQAADSMRLKADGYDEVKDRVSTNVWTKGWKTDVVDDMTISSAYTRHAGKAYGKIQNQIFLVTIADKKILHVADTQMDVRYFDDLRLIYEEIDLAIVPFWFMTNLFGTEIIEKHIAAKKVVGMHLPTSGNDKTIEKINQQMPSAEVFSEPGQKINF
ncbi:hypothetical protein BFP72_12270 [Reichenbachiella sp. 5M10]|nr:hypothetical protein BFP72_12270 [Reichenbachiella sp. 5M10]